MKKLGVVVILLFVGLFLSACGSKPQVATDSAMSTFNKVKEAYNKNDVNLLMQQSTQESVAAINSILSPADGEYLQVEKVTITLSQDAEFIKETKEGDKSIITAKVTSREGKVANIDHVFVKENGVWKFDWIATLNRAG